MQVFRMWMAVSNVKQRVIHLLALAERSLKIALAMRV